MGGADLATPLALALVLDFGLVVAALALALPLAFGRAAIPPLRACCCTASISSSVRMVAVSIARLLSFQSRTAIGSTSSAIASTCVCISPWSHHLTLESRLACIQLPSFCCGRHNSPANSHGEDVCWHPRMLIEKAPKQMCLGEHSDALSHYHHPCGLDACTTLPAAELPALAT